LRYLEISEPASHWNLIRSNNAMCLKPTESRILIISPVKDEAKYLKRTIASMVAQTARPSLWVIVNDGSTDETGAIADAAAAKYSWIRVIHRQRGNERRVGPGVVEAFYEGLESTRLRDFDFVCKLDGDLEFPPNYFSDLLKKFSTDPALGTASGKCFVPVGEQLVLERTGDEFSHGVAKLYRRECFEQIGGFVREVMWDGIDCHRCRMLGWKAASVDDPALRITHLRLMGSSFKSVYHGRIRWGRGQYFMGTHPLYLLAITAYRMLERPWIVGGLCILFGYFMAWFRGMQQYGDQRFRNHLHSWQLGKLGLGRFRRLTNWLGRRMPATARWA
jgi:glycosyltransferase involved in cell wall biosynthesis